MVSSLMLQLNCSPAHLLTKFITFFLLISAFNLPKRSSGDGSEKERTLAIIKPDGLFGNYTSLLKEIILDSGFSISREMMVQLDYDSVKSFYVEHSSKNFFPSLVEYMTSGPVLIMVLEKVNAISDWRALIGPTDAHNAKITHPKSIRAMCGTDITRNCVHGSDSQKSAAREISFFFKETSPVMSFMEGLVNLCAWGAYSSYVVTKEDLFQNMMNCKLINPKKNLQPTALPPLLENSST